MIIMTQSMKKLIGIMSGVNNFTHNIITICLEVMSGHLEWAFFSILTHTDIWNIIKKFTYGQKKKSNIYYYRNGDIATFYGYVDILKCNKYLFFTPEAVAGLRKMAIWKQLNGCTRIKKMDSMNLQ
jgi:hypothetical protein